MNIFKLLKSIPFLLTLVIIAILNLYNNKEYMKLKLLLWNTPSLSLGTYITISAGTGYLLSYVFTTTLSKDRKLKAEKGIRYKSINEDFENNLYQDQSREINYDNILIERDIKDPSPTINASFRVIGKKNKNIDLSDNDLIHEYDSPYNRKFYKSEYDKNETNNEFKSISSDWEEDNFSNW